MSWMAYCWREAFECERLARVEDGEAREEWREAAEHWFHQSARAAAGPAPAVFRRRREPVLSP
ncbi:MAG: hypothetical protein ACOY5Y_13990 [Pseudomonadota bacterium]|jgi:hypothetical protein